MARIRTIKPEFFTSEDIVELSAFARLLYIALWCEADREGRLAWKPRTFKMRYFPADNINIEELCEEIISRGLVVLYEDGLAYIPTFCEHQHINPRESQSTFPEPKNVTRRDASARVTNSACTVTDVQVGREGKEGIQHASKRVESAQPEGFAEFWIAYPRKIGKGSAEKAWRKARLGKPMLQTILKAIERARATEQWRKDGGQYIPHPATWLNERRWEDEPENSAALPADSPFVGML